uniref:Uncharacterized protein n=1 Tax=Globodera rostochiensis TaxID=31243 RepID=A0A914HCL1_GLORO
MGIDPSQVNDGMGPLEYGTQKNSPLKCRNKNAVTTLIGRFPVASANVFSIHCYANIWTNGTQCRHHNRRWPENARTNGAPCFDPPNKIICCANFAGWCSTTKRSMTNRRRHRRHWHWHLLTAATATTTAAAAVVTAWTPSRRCCHGCAWHWRSRCQCTV